MSRVAPRGLTYNEGVRQEVARLFRQFAQKCEELGIVRVAVTEGVEI